MQPRIKLFIAPEQLTEGAVAAQLNELVTNAYQDADENNGGILIVGPRELFANVEFMTAVEAIEETQRIMVQSCSRAHFNRERSGTLSPHVALHLNSMVNSLGGEESKPAPAPATASKDQSGKDSSPRLGK